MVANPHTQASTQPGRLPARPAEGAAGVMKRGAGPAEAYGAEPLAVDVEPKQLKEMLTYPPEWGPTEWGERRGRELGAVGSRGRTAAAVHGAQALAGP